MLSKNISSFANPSTLHSNLTKLRLLYSQTTAFSTNVQTDKVKYENRSDHFSVINLNAPKNLNSIDLEMVNSMIYKLKEWHLNPSTAPKAVLVQGVGGKAFCAGGDIKNLYDASIGKEDPRVKSEFFAREYLLDYSLTQMKPVQISLWNGIVMGGGVGISVHAPIRIATDNTVYAMPETGIGFFTDVGGSYFLSRVHSNISYGLFLAITGFRLKARELVKWGVATHFVPGNRIEEMI